MTERRVWAPHARQVDLQTGAQRTPMCPEAGGWWSAAAPNGIHGADYAFVLDGADPLPDPRSPWQPAGVHGGSRMVDQARFEWHDTGWCAPPLSSAIIYEAHIGTFTPEGTFRAAIERLDYLKQLGVTHLELMPIAEFPGDWGWGYDGVDLFAPHHAYGGPEGLKSLVNACHARGLAVLLDVVYNHLGPSGNYPGKFGPYFTGRYSTPWGPAVNLDGPGSTEVRRFLCDNALMWLRDYHFDGLRLDAVHAIFDSSAVHFLEQLTSEVKMLEAHLGRTLAIIAESDLNDPRIVTPREAGGYGCDAQWSDDFHHALHALLTGERNGYYADFGSLADLAKALGNAFVYDGRESAFRGRRHGRKPRGLAGHRFLAYMQTHDQVGNRAKGERSSQLLSLSRLKIAAAVVLCSPFIPMLFQGEEFGASTPFQYFTNHRDLEVAHAVSRGRREEFVAFGWNPDEVPDPQDPGTFQRSKLNWQEIGREPHLSLLDWHRRLIALRRSTLELSDGRMDLVDVQFSEPEHWLSFTRGPYVVAVNLSEQPRKLRGPVLLASSGGIRDELPPDSVAIVRHSLQRF